MHSKSASLVTSSVDDSDNSESASLKIPSSNKSEVMSLLTSSDNNSDLESLTKSSGNNSESISIPTLSVDISEFVSIPTPSEDNSHHNNTDSAEYEFTNDEKIEIDCLEALDEVDMKVISILKAIGCGQDSKRMLGLFWRTHCCDLNTFYRK